MKKPIYEASMMTNAHTGEYTIWTYYDDGTCSERKAPRAAFLLDTIWRGTIAGEWSLVDLSGEVRTAVVKDVDLVRKVVTLE